MNKQPKKDSLPKDATRKELAEFWDTHSVVDYLDELKPVKVRFAKNLSEGITIRFTPEILTQLRLVAQEKGIGPTTLARMWILEHLRDIRNGRTGQKRSL